MQFAPRQIEQIGWFFLHKKALGWALDGYLTAIQEVPGSIPGYTGTLEIFLEV